MLTLHWQNNLISATNSDAMNAYDYSLKTTTQAMILNHHYKSILISIENGLIFFWRFPYFFTLVD